MTAIATHEALTDSDLVSASRQGDREAFGRIVRKYQGLISGLIYSACGDLSSSEDIAQETFLAAWKSLSGLREPQKLAAWLCQIARHRMLDQNRENARENTRLARAITKYDASAAPRPDEQAMTAEEREVLWRSLAEIAEPYRETLVLYYRQNQSTEEVATALEISEETVRQRLARGRQMLHEQVAAMLERNLARSAPSAQFASAVLAALPALIAQSAAASAAGGVAKASGAAKGLASLPFLAIWIGPIIGLLGGIFGTAASIRATQTPRERRFMVRMSVVIWVFVIVAMAVLFTIMQVSQRYHWSMKTSLSVQAGFWGVYCAALVVMIVKMNRRHRAVRVAEGLPEIPQAAAMQISPMARFISLAGATVGSLAWMFALAIPARDVLGSAIVLAMGAILLAWGWWTICKRGQTNMRRIYFQYVAVLGVFNFFMVNWRMHWWLARMSGMSMERVRGGIPLWSANLLLAVIWVFIFALMWATTRGKEADRTAQTVR